MLKVTKRDGRIEGYKPEKIVKSIQRAIDSSGEVIPPSIIKDINERVVKYVNLLVDKVEKISVDDIHGYVIFILNDLNKEIGRVYREYHEELSASRDDEMDLLLRVARLKMNDKDIVNENANKDSKTFSTKRDLMAGQIAKAEGLKILPKDVRDAHLRGEIHFHDLDYSPYLPYTNCCLPDIEGMLRDGFIMGNASIGTPKSIQTAVNQISQVLASVSSSQYGGTSIDRIDELLEPYAQMNYDKNLELAQEYNIPDPEKFAYERTVKNIYDAMQSLEYEVNTLYTSNGQTPFVTIGGFLGESWICREIQKAILQVRMKGLGEDGKTAIFPKILFTLKDGLNLKPEDPNYDIKQLAVKCSSQRIYPDILNYDKIVELTGSYKASMGCRSFLQGWTNPETGKSENLGRSNLGVVTLNLPRIALQTTGNVEEFWKVFDQRMELVHKALKIRKESVFTADPSGAPVLYRYGAFGKRLNPGDSVKELFLNKRATISVGYIGLYEVGTLFYGPNWETNPEAKEFTLDILRRMKEYTVKWSDEEDIWYSVYGTPSESLTDRFCKLDKKKFGSVENVTDKDYYTNSFHMDVRKKPTPFEKIDFEKDYPVHASGGFIHYVELPNTRHNLKALEAVWDYSYDKVGYFGVNSPIDKCFECDFEGDFTPTEHGFKCPSCGNSDPERSDVVKRTCGYLGSPLARPMAKGRHKEISSRVKHM